METHGRDEQAAAAAAAAAAVPAVAAEGEDGEHSAANARAQRSVRLRVRLRNDQYSGVSPRRARVAAPLRTCVARFRHAGRVLREVLLIVGATSAPGAKRVRLEEGSARAVGGREHGVGEGGGGGGDEEATAKGGGGGAEGQGGREEHGGQEEHEEDDEDDEGCAARKRVGSQDGQSDDGVEGEQEEQEEQDQEQEDGAIFDSEQDLGLDPAVGNGPDDPLEARPSIERMTARQRALYLEEGAQDLLALPMSQRGQGRVLSDAQMLRRTEQAQRRRAMLEKKSEAERLSTVHRLLLKSTAGSARRRRGSRAEKPAHGGAQGKGVLSGSAARRPGIIFVSNAQVRQVVAFPPAAPLPWVLFDAPQPAPL